MSQKKKSINLYQYQIRSHHQCSSDQFLITERIVNSNQIRFCSVSIRLKCSQNLKETVCRSWRFPKANQIVTVWIIRHQLSTVIVTVLLLPMLTNAPWHQASPSRITPHPLCHRWPAYNEGLKVYLASLQLKINDCYQMLNLWLFLAIKYTV